MSGHTEAVNGEGLVVAGTVNSFSTHELTFRGVQPVALIDRLHLAPRYRP